MNIGDVLFQLFSFGFLVFTIVLIVLLYHSYSKRRNQLDRIEKKLDALNEQITSANE
ncbi:DUF4083 domain-containing protein [Bacillus sp. FJAT-49732]|uniref:DUF4083 domain-containing protein n=1 Tax=Lederbergia citrisecunda TaxID=2833583 RepID=A0A942TMJ6_9BACI|nr:DUF4083 domain-containing protein [Lederbergia citrisecunda]